MKFLSVDWMMASTRPLRQAAVTSWHRAADWMPYALLMTCGMPCLLQSLACELQTPSHLEDVSAGELLQTLSAPAGGE